tara:strand:- start:686 stop:913 length:228 start_codon:yes stop_codon:yes gene_type:complete
MLLNYSLKGISLDEGLVTVKALVRSVANQPNLNSEWAIKASTHLNSITHLLSPFVVSIIAERPFSFSFSSSFPFD